MFFKKKGEEMMGKKKWFVLGLVFLVGAAMAVPAWADDQPKSYLPWGFSGSIGLEFNSAYIDPLNNSKISSSGVLQPTLILKHKSGLYGKAQATFGITENESKNDYTWTLGYENNKLPYGLGLNLYGSYYDPPKVWHARGDWWIVGLELNRPFPIGKSQTLTPYASYNYVMGSQDYKDANGLAKFGARYNLALNKKFSFDFDLSGSYDQGIYKQSSAWLGRGEGAFNWKLTNNLVWQVAKGGVYYDFSSSPKSEFRSDTNWVVGSNLTFLF
jgi:hypothetical protein